MVRFQETQVMESDLISKSIVEGRFWLLSKAKYTSGLLVYISGMLRT